MADSRLHIGSEGPLSPDDVAYRGFATVRKGYDPIDVRAFLEAVGAELRRLRDRIEELDPANAPPPAQPERPVIDIATLTTALGEETARVLRAAQEAAADLRTRAEEGATRALSEAHEEASRLRGLAEALLAERTAEADQMAAKLRAEVGEEVAKLRAEVAAEVDSRQAAAVTEAEAAVQSAVVKGREMVGEAQAARERMLTDLARRRKAALIQLEQLRAGRERLLDAYRAVRTSLDDITAQLETADEQARVAAEAAAHRATAPAEETHELAEPAESAEPGPAAPAESVESAEAGAAPEQALAEHADSERAEPERAEIQPAAAPVPETTPAPAPVAQAPARTSKRGRRRLKGGGDAVPVATLPASAVGADAPEVLNKPHVDSGVDELFAKIRADRAEEALDAPAPAVEAEPATVEPPTDATAADEAATDEVATGAQHEMEPPRSNADEAWLQQRDQALDPLSTALTRKIKRLLQDEQNVVLDRLRTHRGAVTAEAVLPAAAAHVAPYVEAALATLTEAEAVGATLAAGIGPVDTAVASGAAEQALAELAAATAAELIDPLRARLDRSLAEEGSDQSTATELVNAAYRELKSARIERVVGDQLTAAVSLGMRRVLAAGTPVRWVVEDIDGPCPDCDDNALAGPIPLGEEFPTGQVAPPAHPGCRCLLGPPSA